MIFVLRHAEAISNVMTTNEINPPLTKKGIEDCDKICGYYDHIICSPLLRCKQTIEHSNISYHEIEYLDLVREHMVEKCDLIREGEGRENEIDILNRIELFKKHLKDKKYKKKSILICTHADFIWYLTSKVNEGRNNLRTGTWTENGQILNIIDCL